MYVVRSQIVQDIVSFSKFSLTRTPPGAFDNAVRQGLVVSVDPLTLEYIFISFDRGTTGQRTR